MNTAEVVDATATTTVFLDHAQRLNLVMLIYHLDEPINGEIRELWALVDRLALSKEDQQAIGMYNRIFKDEKGQIIGEEQGWDHTKSIPAKEYDLSEMDIQRLKRALQGYPRHKVGQARPWLEPLLMQLPQLAEKKG